MVVRAKIIIITQNAKLHNHKNTAHHLFKKMGEKKVAMILNSQPLLLR